MSSKEWALTHIDAVHENTRDFFAANPNRTFYVRPSFEEENTLFNRPGSEGRYAWSLVLLDQHRFCCTRYLTALPTLWDQHNPDVDDRMARLWSELDEDLIKQGHNPSPFTLRALLFLISIRTVMRRSHRH